MHVGVIGPRQLQIAWGELGIREIAGDKDNPRIIEYHAATRLKATDDEVAWCSAFACWSFEQAGIESPRSAAARSWLLWGREVHAVELGCVAVFRRGPNPNQGHVGFPVGTTASGDLVILGGNQENAVSVQVQPISRLLGLRAT